MAKFELAQQREHLQHICTSDFLHQWWDLTDNVFLPLVDLGLQNKGHGYWEFWLRLDNIMVIFYYRHKKSKNHVANWHLSSCKKTVTFLLACRNLPRKANLKEYCQAQVQIQIQSRSIPSPFQIYFNSFQSIPIQNQMIWTRSWCYFHCVTTTTHCTMGNLQVPGRHSF